MIHTAPGAPTCFGVGCHNLEITQWLSVFCDMSADEAGEAALEAAAALSADGRQYLDNAVLARYPAAAGRDGTRLPEDTSAGTVAPLALFLLPQSLLPWPPAKIGPACCDSGAASYNEKPVLRCSMAHLPFRMIDKMLELSETIHTVSLTMN